MKKIAILISIFCLFACSKEVMFDSYPCADGDCNALIQLDPLVSPGVYQDDNGYWNIEYNGINYFTIETQLDEVVDEYVVNGVPLVEVGYDSDTWVAFDSLSFTVPTYSYLGWFTDGEFNNPIPVGELTYTLTDIVQLSPPLNIAGYQIQKNFCWECPYAETLIGTKTKYSYYTRQQIFMYPRMIGDTVKVYVKAAWGEKNGIREELEKEFKIIIN